MNVSKIVCVEHKCECIAICFVTLFDRVRSTHKLANRPNLVACEMKLTLHRHFANRDFISFVRKLFHRVVCNRLIQFACCRHSYQFILSLVKRCNTHFEISHKSIDIEIVSCSCAHSLMCMTNKQRINVCDLIQIVIVISTETST